MARSPDQTHEPSNITLRGRQRLPVGRPVTVRVVRASLSLHVLLLLVLLCAAFVGGVWAGTSGQYREFIHWVTAPLPEGSRLRSTLLAPDISNRPLLSGRIAELEGRLAAVQAGLEQVQAGVGRQAGTMIELRRDIPPALESCATSAHGAWNSSYAALEVNKRLETYFFGALQACMSALDAANTPAPGVTEHVPAAESSAEAATANN